MLSPTRTGYRLDTFEFIEGLVEGDPGVWITLGVIAATVAFFAVYEKVTGRSYVKDTEERRRAKHRHKHVLWEYRRDR
jgi:hypothetical protein